MTNFLTKVVVASSLLLSTAAQAHFQLVFTPQVIFERTSDVPLKLLFWHPFENGHVMDMVTPQSFYAVHKGKKIDLMNSLKPMRFKGSSNEGDGFDASIKLKRNGDYILVVEPTPYFEGSEDMFIQQITKSYLNKGGVPSGWEEPVGLVAEIIPLNKPTNVIAGSTFTGRVLSEGKPVAGAEIEVEYLAATPDMDTNSPTSTTATPPAGGTIVALSDANGYFTFGIPKAGFWGFAALGVGPATEYEGKALSQDAVIWIKAHDID
ncbi:DUF4198 domain-containing protein [Cohaesibacter celericrescens]|uniref:DUF4198 domain-containing protein n=1 Tax=Cohaesibacter celericrescens TaxID=2067669 RepID=A0A2N5XW18_9HYPH|nr:DUF4198 domain-containing protein [Cohaesibacter celericrescens]PLW78625.1 DUF4198 domain-containing protein [Cohaesibacter celericrescens]